MLPENAQPDVALALRDLFVNFVIPSFRKLVSFLLPFLGYFVVSLMFPSVRKSVIKLISDALKPELTTGPGRINLVGMLALLLLMLSQSATGDMNGTTKAFVLGASFLISLFIVSRNDKAKKKHNDKS